MALLNVTEYARHRGVRKAAVEYALERGRIKKNDEGLIDSDEADRDWEANTDHRQARPGPKPPKTSHRESVPFTEHRQEIQADIAEAGTLNFANARAVREIYAGRLLRLEYEQKQATLMPRSQVDIATFNVYRIVRDGLLNIPDRIAAQLAVETDPAVVYDTLSREINLALEALSKQLAEEPAA